MAIPRSKRKSAALNRDDHEDHLRNNQARNTNSPRFQEDDVIQLSEELKGRVTKNCLRISVGQRVAFWVPCQD